MLQGGAVAVAGGGHEGVLEALDGVLVEAAERGVHLGRVQGFMLRVVETSVAWPNPGEHLLYAVSPACLQRPGVPGALDDTERALYYRLVQGISQLSDDPRWKAIMKDAQLAKEAANRALRDLLASLPPEVRLAGLDPEERLAVLDPEVRLAGLAPEERLLAMPDEALRALSDSYLATLPEDVQARIRARLAR